MFEEESKYSGKIPLSSWEWREETKQRDLKINDYYDFLTEGR